MILNLGSHDLIFGRKFFAHFNVLLDCSKNRLQWPSDLPKTNTFAKEILTYRGEVVSDKPIDLRAQQDLVRRDQAIKKDEARHEARRSQSSPTSIIQRPQITPSDFAGPAPPNDSLSDSGYESQDIECIEKPTPIPKAKWNSSHRADLKARLSRMEQELSGTVPQQSTPFVRKSKADKKLVEIDVALISPAGFHHNLYKEDNELFTTSLYEVDRILADKRAEERDTEDRENEELVQSLLPSHLREFKDIFSKSAADEIPPHRVYDHKIVLEDDKALSHSPLYNHSAKELEALKAYLVDNLAKGFIESSQAPFGAPILFVKKPNGSLRYDSVWTTAS